MKYVFILYAKFTLGTCVCQIQKLKLPYKKKATEKTNAVNDESFLYFCMILSLAEVVDFIFLHLRVLTKLSKDTFTGVRWLCSI